MQKRLVDNLLYKELSYQVHGAAIEVRKDFGPGHKETVYQKAFADELKRRDVVFEKEKSIKIHSPKDGKYVGLYRPDFVVDSKIVVETKAERFVRRDEIKRVYDYLRNSEYELAYLINFASPRLFVRRVIYTNDRKPFVRTLLVSISFLLVSFSVLFRGLPVQGAELYFGAQAQEVGVGQLVEVGVFLNTDGQQVNAVEGRVTFPADLLEAREVRDGGSIVSFWIDKPVRVGSCSVLCELVFSGIVPGGYSGPRGYLFSMILQVKAAGEATITTSNDQALLHDGQGTKADLRRSPLVLRIKETGIVPEFAPSADTEPPETFVPAIAQDPNVFDGKWFVAFATQDKGSGIDHYEVQESRKQKVENRRWRMSESPYVLRDQKLRSFVYVKAVDQAGNERVALLTPQYPRRWYEDYRVWSIIGAILIVFYGIWRRKHKVNH